MGLLNNDLISRSALFEIVEPRLTFLRKEYGFYYHYTDGYEECADCIETAPAVDAVEVGNCNGCIWEGRKRPQKCSCCRRNPDMKDCYEERKDDD